MEEENPVPSQAEAALGALGLARPGRRTGPAAMVPDWPKLPEGPRLRSACRAFWTVVLQMQPARAWPMNRHELGAAVEADSEQRPDQIMPCVESAHLCLGMGKDGSRYRMSHSGSTVSRR
jgi:hypothetical protein